AAVGVLAGRVVVGVPAAAGRVARLVGARVVVVAIERGSARAHAVAAHVHGGAGVAVLAGGRVVGVPAAAADRVARVVGAGIVVVAVDPVAGRGIELGIDGRIDAARAPGAARAADPARAAAAPPPPSGPPGPAPTTSAAAP